MNYTPIPTDFYSGKLLDAYRYLGAHPAKEGGYIFRVWAPNASRVMVLGDWNQWSGEDLNWEPGGMWSGWCPNAVCDQYYKINVCSQNGNWVLRSDPYAFASDLRPGTASRLTDIEHFRWDDREWMRRRDKNYDKTMNIYELHAGSWKHAAEGSDDDGSVWYNYEELADQLIPWLQSHAYTHVEFLPLSEHPFDGSWGYQTTGYFSVTSRYGTPAQFAAMVNKLHRAGIGVIMDFVPVHFAANGDALVRFDGTALYEYDSDVGYSEWGTCNFNYYRGEVCSFLASAAAIWLDIYHCDGLRMDAISRAIYWQGDENRGVNEGAVRFLQNMNTGLHRLAPSAMLIAEDSTSYPKVTAPVPYDGLGFDYKWDMGWMHDTLDFFATPFNERRDHYHKLTFSMAYFYHELFLLSLSHDEVVHGKKTIIDKLWGTYEEKCATVRQLYMYMYTHPGKKLLFMGNETAHFREWDEKKELDWFLLEYPFHDAFQKYMGELGKLYRNYPALYEGEYNSQNFEWIAVESRDEGVYAYVRRARGQSILFVMNTQYYTHEAFPLYFRNPCKAHELLGSQWQEWGGTGEHLPDLTTTKGGVFGRDYTMKVKLAPMSASIFLLTE